MKESIVDTRTKAASFAKCMESFEFVIVAVPMITKYIIGMAKPLSLELQKSSCNRVQAQAEANHAKIVISKHRTEVVYSGLYKRAVGIAEKVNVTPANQRPTFFSRQKHSANAEADTEETYFRGNVFYQWRNGATFPQCSNHILQVSYFKPCNIHKLDEYAVLGSME